MKTFKIILICIFSATLAFVAFRSSLRGTKAIYETTQPQYREIKEEINISGNVFTDEGDRNKIADIGSPGQD